MYVFNDSENCAWIEARAHISNGKYSNDYDAMFKVADVVSAMAAVVRTDTGWTRITLSNGTNMVVNIPLADLRKYLIHCEGGTFREE